VLFAAVQVPVMRIIRHINRGDNTGPRIDFGKQGKAIHPRTLDPPTGMVRRAKPRARLVHDALALCCNIRYCHENRNNFFTLLLQCPVYTLTQKISCDKRITHMADGNTGISPDVLHKAKTAAAPIRVADKGTEKKDPPVFNIAAEAKATAHGKTTLNEDQKKEYDKLIDLYGKAGDRLGSPTWSAQDAKNLKALTSELDKVEKMPEADRTAITGKLMYHAGHLSGKGTGLLADVVNHVPSSKDILFTDQKGKNVSFPEILKEGINVNTSDVKSTLYDVQQNPDLWQSVKDTALKAHKLEVTDAKASRQR
jgi:hypothetical protein